MNIKISFLLTIIVFASALQGMGKKLSTSLPIAIPGAGDAKGRLANVEPRPLPWHVADKVEKAEYDPSLRSSDEQEFMPQSLRTYQDNKKSRGTIITTQKQEKKKKDLRNAQIGVLALAEPTGGAVINAKFLPKKISAPTPLHVRSSPLPRRQCPKAEEDDFLMFGMSYAPSGYLGYGDNSGDREPLTRTSFSGEEDDESSNNEQASSEDEIKWNQFDD